MCHALAGPVWAMANGCDLLQKEGGCDEETLALLSASVISTARRLRFFRAALGHPAAPHVNGGADLRRLLSEFLDVWRGNIGLDWSVPDTLIDSQQGRLVLVMTLACERLPARGRAIGGPPGKGSCHGHRHRRQRPSGRFRGGCSDPVPGRGAAPNRTSFYGTKEPARHVRCRSYPGDDLGGYNGRSAERIPD